MSPNAMLRMRDIRLESGHPRSTLYRFQSVGLWPKFVKLGPRSVGQPAYEIAVMNTARAAGWSDEEIRKLVVKLEEARLQGAIDDAALAALVAPQRPAKPSAAALAREAVPA